jgi:hypothetical protein
MQTVDNNNNPTQNNLYALLTAVSCKAMCPHVFIFPSSVWDGGGMFLRNVGIGLQVHTEIQPRTPTWTLSQRTQRVPYSHVLFIFTSKRWDYVRFKVLTAASTKFRIVFWDVLPCKIIADRRFRGACCLHHQGWVIPDDGGSASQKTILNRWDYVWIAVTSGSTVHTLGDVWVCGMISTGKNRRTQKNPVPGPLCPPHIPPGRCQPPANKKFSDRTPNVHRTWKMATKRSHRTCNNSTISHRNII